MSFSRSVVDDWRSTSSGRANLRLWIQAKVLRHLLNVRDEVTCGRQDFRYGPSISTTPNSARQGPEITAATLAEEARG